MRATKARSSDNQSEESNTAKPEKILFSGRARLGDGGRLQQDSDLIRGDGDGDGEGRVWAGGGGWTARHEGLKSPLLGHRL